jgi:hypothetical protein
MSNIKLETTQRTSLASLIGNKRDAVRHEMSKRYPYSEHACILQYLKQKGLSETLKKYKSVEDQISTLRDELEAHKTAIAKHGIDINGLSSFSQSWHAPEELRDFLAEERRKLQEPVEKALAKYDKAIAKIWTASDAEQLCKAVEELI